MFGRFRRSDDLTAFAFSGGGPRAATQVGMLKALSEAGIQPHLLTGTSAGAVNAAWLALNPDGLDRLQDIWLALRMRDVFPGSSVRMLVNLARRGYVHASHAWEGFLRSQVGAASFEDTKIPCAIVAVRLSDGKLTVFDSGEIVPAVMASTAIPGVFPPYRIGDEWYVDGGVLEYMPVPTALERRATTIYALDTSGTIFDPLSQRSVADRCGIFASRASCDAVLQLHVTRGAKVHLLRPPIPELTDARDFGQTLQLIQSGYDYTRAYFHESGIGSAGDGGVRHG